MPFQKLLFGSLLFLIGAGALAQSPTPQEMEEAKRKIATGNGSHPRPPTRRPGVYQPNYSEKIEADNGAVYAIDLKSARRFAAGVEAGVYDQGRGGIIPMYFDCAGHMGALGGPMDYIPPRSVGARLAAIACAEANRHPER
jgi:hypothetical protein